jgi:hypothetical protein
VACSYVIHRAHKAEQARRVKTPARQRRGGRSSSPAAAHVEVGPHLRRRHARRSQARRLGLRSADPPRCQGAATGEHICELGSGARGGRALLSGNGTCGRRALLSGGGATLCLSGAGGSQGAAVGGRIRLGAPRKQSPAGGSASSIRVGVESSS